MGQMILSRKKTSYGTQKVRIRFGYQCKKCRKFVATEHTYTLPPKPPDLKKRFRLVSYCPKCKHSHFHWVRLKESSSPENTEPSLGEVLIKVV